MNKEHCLAFNKMVDCYLNNQINNLFDLEENMKALNNFQAKIDELQEMKDLMDNQGYTAPFRSLSKYGTNTVGEVSVEEMGESSRHNQYFRMSHTNYCYKRNLTNKI